MRTWHTSQLASTSHLPETGPAVIFRRLVAILAFLLCARLAAAGATTVGGLRCESLRDPLGIDTLRPRLSWVLRSDARGAAQTAYQVIASSSRDALDADRGDLWDSGRVESAESTSIVYAGAPLVSGRACFWKVRVWDEQGQPSPWSAPATWSIGLLEDSDWQGQWIGADDAPPPPARRFFRNGDPNAAAALATAESPAILLRHEADLPARPVRATAYVAGLGYQELYINGRRVGDHVLDPVFTDYSRRICYVTHDVTSLLRQGPNAVGVMLGNGFYHQPTPDLFQFEKAAWRRPPRIRLDIVVEFANGATRRIVSDRAWTWSTGPIRFNCIRGGETIDARVDPGAWTEPGFHDPAWKPVARVTPPPAPLAAQMVPPMRVIRTLVPVAITEPRPGVYVADFGMNLTGWVRLESRGTAGRKVQIEFNETLRPDGTLETGHSASHTYGRFQRGEFILSGRDTPDVFEPRFTYHGFRYVQITGLPERPSPDSLRASLAHTDLAEAGSFECSNPRLNELHAAVRRTLLDSVHGMPGEEATREKMGWNQDAQNTFESYAFNFDAHAIYRKYVQDMIDGQEPNGHVPPILPTNGWGNLDGEGQVEFCDDPWWGASLAVIVDHLYTYYGDREILERAYEPMRRYVDWVGSTAQDKVVSWSLGDWLELNHGKPSRLTPVPVTSTAGYYHLANLLAGHARILGRSEDAGKYARLADDIRAAYNARFLSADGWYQQASQTAQALALQVGLVPPDRVEQVRGNLVTDLESRGRHLTTGFIGIMPALYELSDNGFADIAYSAVTHESGSGWLYMVEDENSTLGENIHPAGYGSRHHPFGACVGAWFYRTLAGIRPDPEVPGFRHIIIQPCIAGDLTWVKAHHDSPYGRIEVAWRRDTGKLTLDVVIPPNTTATVHVPTPLPQAIVADGLAPVRTTPTSAVFSIPAGRYRFESPTPANVRSE